MFKKALLVVILILASVNLAYAQEITEYNAHINADGTTLFVEVTLTVLNSHGSTLRKLTYPFSSQVENLKTFDEVGGLESQVELRGGNNYVTTELRNSLTMGENATVRYEFSDSSAVIFFNNTYILSSSFPLLANVKEFDLTLRLPEGTGLHDPNIDVIPAPSEITSDGRAVILRWMESDPSDFRVFVRYEILLQETVNITTTTTTLKSTESVDDVFFKDKTLLILTSLLLLLFISLFLIKLRSGVRLKDKIEILKEDEQLILKIVAEDDGIEQREIQRRTDFSKTKVSKLLAELEKREAIRKESMGKKNRIYLSKKLKE
jgi:uncharacterized membrane protein